jgi:hypothetical protein
VQPWEFGRFHGNVVAEWIDRIRDQKRITDIGMEREPSRVMRLVRPFGFFDRLTQIDWHSPAGSYIDGASIPKFFWRWIGPYEGPYRQASVVHDRACQDKIWPSPMVHEMFYHACRAGGTGVVKARLMWAAVRLFGPRFPGKNGRTS